MKELACQKCQKKLLKDLIWLVDQHTDMWHSSWLVASVCARMCACTHAHACTHTHSHTNQHTHTHTHTHMHQRLSQQQVSSSNFTKKLVKQLALQQMWDFEVSAQAKSKSQLSLQQYTNPLIKDSLACNDAETHSSKSQFAMMHKTHSLKSWHGSQWYRNAFMTVSICLATIHKPTPDSLNLPCSTQTHSWKS